MKRLILLFLSGMLFLAAPSQGASVSSPLPLDSWVYSALDKLEGLGLIQSSLKGSRPYTKREAARLTFEAMRSEAAGNLPVAAELLKELQLELNQELVDLGALPGESSPTYIKPLRSVNVAYAYREGGASFYRGNNARQFALDTNRQGLHYGEGHNGQLILDTEARFWGRVQLSARPVLTVQEEDGDVSVDLLDGRAALGLGPFELSFGRQSQWWGQGRNGALVLSNNAEAFDMIRLTNPTPVLLPWIFKFLGPFRFDVFYSELESDRVVPNPYFAGLRINFRPLPWFEIGGSRTAIFGGDGRPSVDISDFFTILVGRNIAGSDDTSNQLASLDARLTLPFLWNAEFYGELGGEDEAGGFFSRNAYVVGLFLPRVDPTGRLALRLEHSNLAYDGNGPVWYRHPIYQSGYTYYKKIMGHHVGGDSRDYYLSLEAYLPGRVTAAFELDYQERGFSRPVQETHLQPGVSMSWQAGDKYRLSGGYAFDRVQNFEFRSGNDVTNHLTFINLERRF